MCFDTIVAPAEVCVPLQVVGNHLVQGSWPTDCACSEPEIEEITDGRQVETIDNSVLTFERTGDAVTVVTADGTKCQQVKDDVVAGLSVIHIMDTVRATTCLALGVCRLSAVRRAGSAAPVVCGGTPRACSLSLVQIMLFCVLVSLSVDVMSIRL